MNNNSNELEIKYIGFSDVAEIKHEYIRLPKSSFIEEPEENKILLLKLVIPNLKFAEDTLIKAWLSIKVTDQEKCYIWKTKSFYCSLGIQRYLFYSPRAGGWYAIAQSLWFAEERIIDTLTDVQKARLTTFLIDEYEKDPNYIIEITNELIDFVSKLKSTPNEEKGPRLLVYLTKKARIEKQSPTIFGVRISCEQEYKSNYNEDLVHQLKLTAITESQNHWEFNEIIRSYINNHFLHSSIENGENKSEDGIKIAEGLFIGLTYDGQSESEKFEKNKQKELSIQKSKQVFIAMWFDSSMDELRDTIEEGIGGAEFEPFRVDKKDFHSRIDDKIIAEIKRSRLVVADLTHGENGARGSVYYEIGYAHCLERPVIFLCREDQKKEFNNQFDVRQYNCVFWEEDKLENLKETIKKRILLAIEEGY